MGDREASVARVRILTAVLLVVTFAAGTATGAALFRWVAGPRGPLGPPPIFGPLPLEELGLSPEQEQQARAVVERHRPQFEAVLRETFPRLRAITEQTEQELRELLTPEQRTRLDRVQARRAARRRGPPPVGVVPWPSGPRPHPVPLPWPSGEEPGRGGLPALSSLPGP